MSKTKNNGQDSSYNLLAVGTTIEGEIRTNGDIRIDGTLKGTLIVKGKVVIGSTGKVEGEISCQHADISGEIRGQITVSELLHLKASSKLTGDLVVNKLAIDPGARFSGTCSMGGEEEYKRLLNESQQETKAKVRDVEELEEVPAQ